MMLERDHKKRFAELAGLVVASLALLWLSAVVSPAVASSAPENLDEIKQPKGEAKGYCKDKNKDKMKEKCEEEIVVEDIDTTLTQESVFQEPEYCPILEPSNGELDVFSTQLNKSTLKTVRLPGPVNEDVFFEVATTNFNAVDLDKGSGISLPSVSFDSSIVVTVPAGGIRSDAFWVHGKKISPANINITQITTEDTTVFFAPKNVPVNVWELDAIVDYNDLDGDNVCYDETYSNTASSPPLISGAAKTTCGSTPSAVASDGATRLLVRLRSSMEGQACIRARQPFIVDERDPGMTDPENSDTIFSDSEFSDPYWTFGSYISPADYGDDSSVTRDIEIEVAFTPTLDPGATRANTTAVRSNITIRRPPVLLLHGLWSDETTWGKAFRRPEPEKGWSVLAYNYNKSADQSVAFNTNEIKKGLNKLLDKYRKDSAVAVTRADVIAHSMGGLIARKYITFGTIDEEYLQPTNFYEGDIGRIVLITSPIMGSQLANMIINLHNVFDHNTHAGLRYLERQLPGGIHNGAICDLADNNPNLEFPGSDVRARAQTTTGGPTSGLPKLFSIPARKFTNMEQLTHINPYAFARPNDMLVGEESQNHENSIPAYNDSSLIHFAIGNFFGITVSKETADRVFKDLSDTGPQGAVFSTMQSLTIDAADEGIPRFGGRGSIDQNNYNAQCEFLGDPMRLN